MEHSGRTFPGQRTVRLGDVTATGRLRLDAVARYLQDVATDDATDAGLPDGWVLRRCVLRVHRFPVFREVVDLVTWCSGIAGSAAERSTTLSVDGEPVIEAVALWPFVGPDGRPARLDRERFTAAGIPTDRRIGTRLLHAEGPGPEEPGARVVGWPLRATDVDVLRHVNNAVSFAAAEDVLQREGRDAAPAPWAVEVEYRIPIEPGDPTELVWSRDDHGVLAGALRCAGTTRSTFRLAVPGTSAART